MKKFHSPLLSAIRQALHLATISEKKDDSYVDEWLEKMPQRHASRRQFLKETAFAGAAVSGVGNLLNPNFILSKNSDPKVAIVGAGIAGLTAAFYLKEAGIKAVLYEGDKRIGGRIKSANIFANGQLTTEIGAEFIDTGHEEMIKLAKMLGLWDNKIDVTLDTFGTKDAFFIDGQHRTMKEVVIELQNIVPILKKDKLDAGKDFDTPRAKELDNISLQTYLEKLPISDWVKKLLNAAFLGEQGLDAQELSSLCFIDTVEIGEEAFDMFGASDERYKIRGGNSQITEGLAKRLSEQIRLEHRLLSIKEQANGSIQLTFDVNGQTVEAVFDAVIMAIPFSILRGVELKMDLPPIQKQVIQDLAYGSNTKFIMEFKERVWRKSNYQGYLFNNEIHNGWDSSQMQTDNAGIGTFTVFLGGLEAKEAKNTLENDLSKKYLPSLNTIFTGVTEAFTGKTELANWSKNPFIKASYSSLSVGQYTTLYGQAGKPVRNLFFAGEHCSVNHWGFMNGGAETGRLAAEAILKKR